MRDGDTINLERRLGMLEGKRGKVSTFDKDDPRPDTLAKEWSPSPNSILPLFVKQYLPYRKAKYPWVMILDAGEDALTDQPGAGGCKAIWPCPGDQNARLGHVERHVHIPAWLEPYIKLINESGSRKSAGAPVDDASLDFYSSSSQYKDLDISIAHDLPRCQLLQVLFLHGTILHNIDSIDWDLAMSDKGSPSHRIPKDAARSNALPTNTVPPVKTTWPDHSINNIWATLAKLIGKDHTLDSPDPTRESDFGKAYPNSVFSNGAFGPENDWPLGFDKVGYDHIFYMLTNNSDEDSILAHQLVIPKGLNSAVCEHTLRTKFKRSGSTVSGGYLDLPKQQSICHEIDKLVYLLLSLLRYEAVRHDLASTSTPLPLPSTK